MPGCISIRRVFRVWAPVAILVLVGLFLFTDHFRQPGLNHHDENIQSSTDSDIPATVLSAGTPPSQGRRPSSKYSRALVVAKLKKEDTTWVDRVTKYDPDLSSTVYVVDDPNADPFIIRNKGHELMPYLTYIIDNYEVLRNITIFMHAHKAAWHNNAFFNLSSETMVNRLSSEHVIREGYVNLRCKHDPGCPDHIRPFLLEDEDIGAVPEAAVFGKAWSELFPLEPVPDVLAQPCCSQFAVSSEKIRSIPLQKYIFWRDWVLRVPLPDRLTGRVWEYLWQYIFLGKTVHCPDEFTCACEGYGFCSRKDE